MGGPYYGRWGVNDVLERRLDSDWPSASDATSTSGGYKITQVTATSTTSETVTFS